MESANPEESWSVNFVPESGLFVDLFLQFVKVIGVIFECPGIVFTCAQSNSKHWFTTSFLQPQPYLATP